MRGSRAESMPSMNHIVSPRPLSIPEERSLRHAKRSVVEQAQKEEERRNDRSDNRLDTSFSSLISISRGDLEKTVKPPSGDKHHYHRKLESLPTPTAIYAGSSTKGRSDRRRRHSLV
jgi:hypothetical protein